MAALAVERVVERRAAVRPAPAPRASATASATQRRARAGTPHDSVATPEHDRHRAVHRAALGAEAPQQIVVLRRVVDGLLALGARAAAAHAERLPAAVVVRDDVVLAVAGIAAGADPGDRRHLGARRARVLRAAAARAEEAVDRAVAPVAAVRRIAGVAGEPGVVGRRQRAIVLGRARHREERQRRARPPAPRRAAPGSCGATCGAPACARRARRAGRSSSSHRRRRLRCARASRST